MTFTEAIGLDVGAASKKNLREAWIAIGIRKLELRQIKDKLRRNSYESVLRILEQKLDDVLYAWDPHLKHWELYPW